MKLITDGSDTITDKDGNVVYICLERDESSTIPLTYTMVRASGISPSMVYDLVHGDGIYLGEDKFVRTYVNE